MLKGLSETPSRQLRDVMSPGRLIKVHLFSPTTRTKKINTHSSLFKVRDSSKRHTARHPS